ncbi:membrane protein [Candidatus Nitrosocosmicus sp.]|jgi:putative membrane protein|nr:membrane protein [Candidatus Nitrosocosmicus sp.]
MVDDNDDRQKTDRSQQYLANERTFLSWVRTSIAMIGLGFIISKFSLFLTEFRIIIFGYSLESSELNPYQTPSSIDLISNWIGIGTVSLAIVLILFALKNYLSTHKSIKTQTYTPNQKTIYFTTVIIVFLSIIVFVYLVLVPSI